MTVEEYRKLLARNGLSYRVSGDKVYINSKKVPPVVAKATRGMKPQLIAAANPILNARHNMDAKGASETGARKMYAAKQDWNTRMNESVLGMLHGAEKGGGVTGIAADVAEFLYPTSKTGKVLEGLPLAAGALPEETGALALGTLGAGVGALTGAVTGEGAVGGAAQGATFGLGDIWANAAPLAGKLWKGLARDGQLRKLYNKSLNETVASIIGPETKLGKAILGGQNWAKIINTQSAQTEMGQRLEAARDAIRNEMEGQFDAEKEAMEAQFRSRWSGAGKSPAAAGQTKQMIEEGNRIKEYLAQKQNLIDHYDESLDELRRLGKKAYPKGMNADTSSADVAKESMAKLDGNVNRILKEFNPELVNWYKSADDSYAKFKALGHLAAKDIWTEGRGLVDPQKLQTEWLKDPKYYQQRLGDVWGTLHETIGRHSDLLKEGQETDIPGALQRARALMHGGGRLSVFAPISEILQGPRMAKYAGAAEAKTALKAGQPMDEAQKLLAQRFRGQPPIPKRPITRGALFGGVLNPTVERINNATPWRIKP